MSDSLWQYSAESNNSPNATQLSYDNLLYGKKKLYGKESQIQNHHGYNCLFTPPITYSFQSHIDDQPSSLEEDHHIMRGTCHKLTVRSLCWGQLTQSNLVMTCFMDFRILSYNIILLDNKRG